MRRTTYKMVHLMLREWRGRARDYDCIDCAGQAEVWAYQYNAGPDEQYADNGAPYSENIDDHYAPMCRGCHVLFDKRRDPRLSRDVPNREAGHETMRRRWQTDTEFVDRMRGIFRDNAVRMNRRRGRCEECGREMTWPGLGRHRQASGHSQFVEIPAVGAVEEALSELL